MGYDNATERIQQWYARLLRLFPKSYRDEFGESMEQTFMDLYRERREAGSRTTAFLFWVFAETTASICRENMTSMNGIKREILRAATVTGLLLFFPLILTISNSDAHLNGGGGGGWDWGIGDFVVMGMMLLVAGIGLQLAVRKISSPPHRVAAACGIVLTLLLVWVELAVSGVSQAFGFLG